MLTRAQQILLKRAQAQAGIDDTEYRAALAQFCGVQTSKDPALGDDSLDVMLAYFEAIYWRGVDAGILKAPFKGDEPFRKRGFWSDKNRAGNTSRDRFTRQQLGEQIVTTETALMDMGCGPSYLAAIRNRVCQGKSDSHTLQVYLAALQRTLKARHNKAMESGVV